MTATTSSHTEPSHGCADHYCAARDSQGGIRLSGGRGLLVANADHTRRDVEGWFRMSKPGYYREQYRAALRLLDTESLDDGQIAPPVVHPDEGSTYIAPACAHRKVVLHADGGWICVDEPACHQRFVLATTEEAPRG